MLVLLIAVVAELRFLTGFVLLKNDCMSILRQSPLDKTPLPILFKRNPPRKQNLLWTKPHTQNLLDKPSVQKLPWTDPPPLQNHSAKAPRQKPARQTPLTKPRGFCLRIFVRYSWFCQL